MQKARPHAHATAFAERHLRDELKINSLPVDPIMIARSKGILIEAMPRDHDGVSGMLIHAHGRFAIAYATHIRSRGFQRFSIAHELGHYCLPGHIDAVLPEGAMEHLSNSGFHSDDLYELEADHFAVGLLMPSTLFRAAMAKAGSGLDAIDILHERCETSLIATAIRYQQLTEEAVAIVQSHHGKIDFCFFSDSMLALKPRWWPRKGQSIPKSSETYRLHRSPADIVAGVRRDGEADGEDWFDGCGGVDLYEEVIGLGTYGRTLTVISPLDGLDEENTSHDPALDESWTPRFRR